MTDTEHAAVRAENAAREIIETIRRRREGGRWTYSEDPAEMVEEAADDIAALAGWLVVDIGRRRLVDILVREAARWTNGGAARNAMSGGEG